MEFTNLFILLHPFILPSFPVQTSHTSDHFAKCEELARKMILEGKAYMDDTDQEKMQVRCMMNGMRRLVYWKYLSYLPTYLLLCVY